MAERRVTARLEAVVTNFINGFKDAKKSADELTQSTQNANKATQENSRFSEEAAKKIKLVADADQRAAKNAGLLYNANGQLVDSNGKIVSSAQAAAHGVDQFSDAVYLANVEAQESAAATEAAVAKQAEAYKTLAPAVAIVGGAMSLAFGKMLSTYADFDKSMSEVQAATHETAGNMNLMRDAAIEAGADTAFSASEAAAGIKELAKAGVATESIINGGLTGALSLAATDNIEVAKAAEIAASAMTQFKLSGEQVPHIADLLAAGAGKAQGGVEDLGMALNQSGLVAAGVGLTIEETTGALTAFASAGLIGSDSGTSFKTMLQSLTPSSKAAATLMDDLGISAYDAEGSFIGMSEYAGVLQNALKDMSDEQRNATLKTIFGSDAVRAANILYEQGADGIQKWEDAVNDAGYAADTAAAMQNNLAGDLEKLGGSLDTVFLKSGSGANDMLRTLVQTAESFVDFVGKIPEPVLAIGGILTGIVGGTALAGGAIVTLVPKVKETVDAFNDLRSSGSKAPGILASVGKAAAVATIAVGAMATAVELHNKGLEAAKGPGHYALELEKIAAGASGVDGIFNNLDFGDSTAFEGKINGIGDALKELNRGGLDHLGADLGARNGIAILRENIEGLDGALASAVSSGNAEKAAIAWDQVTSAARNQGMPMEKLEGLFPGYIDSLKNVEAESVGAAGGSAEVAEALDEVGVSADGAVENMEDFLEVLFQAGVITRDERAAFRDYQAAIDDIAKSIETNGKSLDAHTEKGRANQAAFDGLAASGQAYVESLAAGGATEEELQAAMSSTYDSLITAAGQFDITGEAADKLAREVMGIPEDVKVDSWMSEAAKKTAEQTKKSVEEIPKRHDVKIVQTFETHGVPYRPQNPLQKQIQDSTPSSIFGSQKKATGGGIFGPGSGTSDSVPIMASNGEHMFTAAEVDLMGGHDAVYRFRAGLRAGSIRGYATGGEIGGVPSGIATAAVMQYSAAPAPAAGGLPPIQVTVNGATDENRVARKVTDELRATLSARGINIGW